MTTTQKDQTEMKTETVCYGDCLEHLKRWVRWNKSLTDHLPSKADLIYLDPPWNTGYNHNVLFGSVESSPDTGETQSAQEAAFTDMWKWDARGDALKRVNRIINPNKEKDYEYYPDPERSKHPAYNSILGLKHMIPKTGMLAYCAYMAERLALLREILKPTGSIYLHCDPHASHYLKLIMDDIFGPKCYRNEIVWCYSGGGISKRYFPLKHDIILCYGKTNQKDTKTQKDPETKTKFNADAVRIPYKSLGGGNGGGAIWGKGHDNERLDELREMGKVVEDCWIDIMPLTRNSKERKYPTQKPLKLLKRIIKASTSPGDVVLDPFCGCGTAVVKARQLGRKFVGIDISLHAVTAVTYDRLTDEAKMPEKEIRITGIPADKDSAKWLAKDDPFAFERFAVQACHPGLFPNVKQRGDQGIDGRGKLLHPVKENGEKKRLILAQVKAGKPTPDQVRAFGHVITHTEGAIAGVFITLEKGDWKDSMREAAADLGTFKHEHSMDEFDKLQHWHIGQFFFKTEHLRLPKLPEMADPSNDKEKVSTRQIGFLANQNYLSG